MRHVWRKPALREKRREGFRLVLWPVEITRLVRRKDVSTRHPTSQINIRTAFRTERPPPFLGFSAANRAAGNRARWRLGIHRVNFRLP